MHIDIDLAKKQAVDDTRVRIFKHFRWKIWQWNSFRTSIRISRHVLVVKVKQNTSMVTTMGCKLRNKIINDIAKTQKILTLTQQVRWLYIDCLFNVLTWYNVTECRRRQSKRNLSRAHRRNFHSLCFFSSLARVLDSLCLVQVYTKSSFNPTTDCLARRLLMLDNNARLCLSVRSRTMLT